MKKTYSFLTTIRQLAVLMVLGVFVSFIAASADWAPPKSSFPTCITDPANPNYNPACLAPVNVGKGQQSKEGTLQIDENFGVIGNVFLGTLAGSKVGIGTTVVDPRSDVIMQVAQNGADAVITGVKIPTNDNDAVNKKYVVDYVLAQVAGGRPQYLGTSAPTTGTMNGIFGAKTKCETAFPSSPGAHMCSYDEFMQSGARAGVDGWIDDGISHGENTATNGFCFHASQLSTNCTGYGVQWNSNTTVQGCTLGPGGESSSQCGISHPIHCCK